MDLYSENSNTSNNGFLLNSSHETKMGGYTRDGWTFEENKIFENAMMNFEDTHSMPFFQHVASLMPWQTIESIQKHEQILMEDMELIKSSDGNFEDLVEEDMEMEDETRKVITPRPKKKGIPWTEEEHRLFLRGLEEEGKGRWKAISRKYLPMKTPTQIASHAQKFEKRKHTKTPLEKRRASINDIQLSSEASFSLDSQGYQPNQPGLFLDSHNFQNQPSFLLESPNFHPNPPSFPFNFSEGFKSNQFNFSLDFQNSQPSQPEQINFPLDSHNFEANQLENANGFKNATYYNHVHNNYGV